MGQKILIGLLVAGILFWAASLIFPFEKRFFLKGSTQEVIDLLPYFMDDTGWNFVLRGSTDGQNSISFESKNGDTLKHVIFSIDSLENATGVIRFTKIFESNGGKFTVRMNAHDTLFSFAIRNSRDTVFQNGEYYYRFTTFKLDTAQQKYYLLYKDSLMAVRGDNLPVLPSLNGVERKRFNINFFSEEN